MWRMSPVSTCVSHVDGNNVVDVNDNKTQIQYHNAPQTHVEKLDDSKVLFNDVDVEKNRQRDVGRG